MIPASTRLGRSTRTYTVKPDPVILIEPLPEDGSEASRGSHFWSDWSFDLSFSSEHGLQINGKGVGQHIREYLNAYPIGFDSGMRSLIVDEVMSAVTWVAQQNEYNFTGQFEKTAWGKAALFVADELSTAQFGGGFDETKTWEYAGQLKQKFDTVAADPVAYAKNILANEWNDAVDYITSTSSAEKGFDSGYVTAKHGTKAVANARLGEAALAVRFGGPRSANTRSEF